MRACLCHASQRTIIYACKLGTHRKPICITPHIDIIDLDKFSNMCEINMYDSGDCDSLILDEIMQTSRTDSSATHLDKFSRCSDTFTCACMAHRRVSTFAQAAINMRESASHLFNKFVRFYMFQLTLAHCTVCVVRHTYTCMVVHMHKPLKDVDMRVSVIIHMYAGSCAHAIERCVCV